MYPITAASGLGFQASAIVGAWPAWDEVESPSTRATAVQNCASRTRGPSVSARSRATTHACDVQIPDNRHDLRLARPRKHVESLVERNAGNPAVSARTGPVSDSYELFV